MKWTPAKSGGLRCDGILGDWLVWRDGHPADHVWRLSLRAAGMNAFPFRARDAFNNAAQAQAFADIVEHRVVLQAEKRDPVCRALAKLRDELRSRARELGITDAELLNRSLVEGMGVCWPEESQ